MRLFCFGCMRWKNSVEKVKVTAKWKGTKIKETSWLCVTCRNKVNELFKEVNKKMNKETEMRMCDRCKKKVNPEELNEYPDDVELPLHVCWKCKQIMEKELDLGDRIVDNFGISWGYRCCCVYGFDDGRRDTPENQKMNG